MKTYEVNVDLTWSQTYRIKAKNAAEAKRKAWERFKKRVQKKDCTIYADKVE